MYIFASMFFYFLLLVFSNFHLVIYSSILILLFFFKFTFITEDILNAVLTIQGSQWFWLGVYVIEGECHSWIQQTKVVINTSRYSNMCDSCNFEGGETTTCSKPNYISLLFCWWKRHLQPFSLSIVPFLLFLFDLSCWHVPISKIWRGLNYRH